MARAQENIEEPPTYLEFFGMTAPPFSRVSEPAQVFHAEQYSLLYEHLNHAGEKPDSLTVICGADGSGKTTLLNRYIAGLSREAFYACFDENCGDAVQFHCGLLRQLGFNDITGSLNELRHISREFLVHRGRAGDHVLLLVDNAQLISATVLEQLVWISDIVVDGSRVVSIVLSGNSDLPRIMDSPAMRSLRFAHQTNFNIRVYTEQETDEYVRHRLRLAGAADSAKFSNESRPLIYRFSGGIPSLINRLCNAVLTEACAQKTRVITDELIRDVAENKKFVPHVVPLHGKGRRRSDAQIPEEPVDPGGEERISPRDVTLRSTEDMLRPEPDRSNSDEAALLTQIAELSYQLAESRAEKAKAEQDIAARDSDINALLDKITGQTKAIEKHAAAQRDSSIEIARLEKVLSENARALEDNEEELQRLAATLKAGEDELTKSEGRLARSDRRLEKLEGLKSDLRASVKERTAELKELKAELKNSTAEFKATLKARDKAISNLEKTLAGVEKECDLLRLDTAAKKELEESLAELQKECDSLRSDAAAKKELEKSLADLQKERDSLRSDAAAAKELEASLDKVLKESDTLRSDATAVEELQKSLARVKKERDSLRTDAVAKTELEESLAEVQRECDSLRSDAAAKKELEKSLAQAEKECDLLRLDTTAKKELENSLAKVQKECDSLRLEVATKKELEKSLREIQKECDSLRSEVTAKKELEESCSRLQKECDTLRAEASAKRELDKSLSQVKKERDSLRSDAAMAEELQAALIRAEKECDSLRSDLSAVDALSKDVEEKESRIAELQKELQSFVDEDTATRVMLLNQRTGTHAGISPDDSASLQKVGSIGKIEVIKDGKVDRLFEIAPGQSRIMIGRNDDSELCLNSKFVSRHHALIFLNKNCAHIEDLRSYNGTVVNGRKTARCDLSSDDEIQIGDFKLRIVSI